MSTSNNVTQTSAYLQSGCIDERCLKNGTPVLYISSGTYGKVEIPVEQWDEIEGKYPKWRVLLGDDVEFVLNRRGKRYFASSVRPVLSRQEIGTCTYWDSEKNYGFLMRQPTEEDSGSEEDVPQIEDFDTTYPGAENDVQDDSVSELSGAAAGLEFGGAVEFDTEFNAEEDEFEDAYEEIFIHISDLWDSEHYDRGNLHLRRGDEVMFTPFEDERTGKKKAVNARFMSENPGYRVPPKRIRKTPLNSTTSSEMSSRRSSITSVSTMAPSVSTVSLASTTSNAWSEGTGVSFERDSNSIISTSNFTYTKNVRGRCIGYDRRNGVLYGYLKAAGHPKLEFAHEHPDIHKNTHVRFTLQTCSDSFGAEEVRVSYVRRDLTRDIAWFKKEIRKCEQTMENLREQRKKGFRIGRIEKQILNTGEKRATWEMWLRDAREERERRKEEKG